MAALKFSKMNKKTGFSLLDVIFAVGITMVGLVAMLSLLRYVVVAGRLSNEKFMANHLAQEGIEMVRGMRDSNWVAGRTWNYGLAGGTYLTQYNSASLFAYANLPLKIDSNGFYNYNTGTDTKFYRTIYIYAGSDSIDVVSEVKWTDTLGQFSAVVEDNLYNWMP
ncbi:MAG: hypothetical protein V1845_00360 [bacterium]